ncbi:DUF6473 family protein [Rhodobacteraceae bacterium KMM 6894]|nr:DUF6473 family protein [Rhodobacteraceae bacterium KMM 6894]
MAYEKLGETPLDYQPCRYGTSKLLFRGPRRRLEGQYAVFLGGTETYGKFIARPFPALIEARTGAKCINLGWPNAGIDVFLHDPDVLAITSRAKLAVIQVSAAQNMSNRFYSVHPRRNDRFVEASPMLRAIYRDVDFTEFHFTRHMLRHLRHVAPDRFALIRDELQTAWVARMRLLLHQIAAPVVLLWLSAHPPKEEADAPDIAEDPAFVTRAMLEMLHPKVLQVVEVTASAAALSYGTRGMVFSEFEGNIASEIMGPAVHEEAAEALSPLIGEVISG